MENVHGEYDLVFGIGQACTCSQTLRKAGLQLSSFPMDWANDADPVHNCEIVASHFDHWLDKDDFVYVKHNPVNGLGIFRNKRTNFMHPHDFADGPIEQSYDAVAAKYRRRIERLLQLIGAARRVLAVCIVRPAMPRVSADDMSKCRAILSSAFPGVSFDVLFFNFAADTALENRKVSSPAEGVTTIEFDYRDPVHDVSVPQTSEAVKALNLRARDYRTDAERKAHVQAERRKKLEKKFKRYGVHSRLGLFFAKLKALFANDKDGVPRDTRAPDMP